MLIVLTLRYASGVYSNSLSGISDLASNYASPSYAMPDIIYDALWNGAANTQDPGRPATDWARHQRIHQYLGGQNVTYAGDTINIDQDYLDVQRAAPAAVAQAGSMIDVFWRGPADHHLWHPRYAPGSGWGKPRDLAGQLSSGPAPAVSGRGALTVFWTGRDGHLWVIRRKPASRWTHPANLGMGRLGGVPAATGLASGEVDVCWPAKPHTSVWQLSFSPGHGWGKAHDLTAGVSAGPVAVAAPATGVDVFWRGSNGTLW